MGITIITVTCGYCGKDCRKHIGHYNRAVKMGNKVYCDRLCGGLGRRKTQEEKKAIKAKYDKEYKNRDYVKKQRKEYWIKDYATNPEKYKQIRQSVYPKHLEYLKTPEYKEYKKNYDEKYRAEKLYGEFSEAAIVLKRLEQELDSQLIKLENGISYNKSTTKRKRKWVQQSKVLNY